MSFVVMCIGLLNLAVLWSAWRQTSEAERLTDEARRILDSAKRVTR